MRRDFAVWLGMIWLAVLTSRAVSSDDLIPPMARMKTDRPRVLLRPKETPYAISLARLRDGRRDADFERMLDQLRRHRSAAAQAMVWLLTAEEAAAEKAMETMRRYEYPGRVDTFHIYFRLCEFGLAYDWLYDYEGFSDRIKADVRRNVMPLARQGLQVTDDHVFHNYIWMSAGGTAIWALATVGEDPESDRLFEQISQRFNRRLFPAMEYLDGLPSEPMGYWALYDFSPGLLALLGAQSAFETDLVGKIEREQNGWLGRHYENLIHSTLPNLRYIPWGDLQGGPNGGVPHEMAGIIDAGCWALGSAHGAYFSRWLARQRGLSRFYGETAVYYMLYTRNLTTQPEVPPRSYLAGNRQGGHFIARSGWEPGDTVVSFRCTDHFGDHNHYDQGSFTVYRHGLLAVDPPVYRRIRGPQQKTEHHNTLLFGGRPQRGVRGQWFKTLDEFRENLDRGRRLETGDILFYREAGSWAAAAGQFAQAYDPAAVRSCVRHVLLLRPDRIVVVDQLTAPQGGDLPEVQWLLQVPRPPSLKGTVLWTSNGKSWLRCRPILPGGSAPVATATPVDTHRASYRYGGAGSRRLVHLLEVGDGQSPDRASRVQARQLPDAVEVTLDGRRFRFAGREPYEVTAR